MSISQIKTIDLESYEIVQKLYRSKTYRYYQIRDIDTGKDYLAKIRKFCFEKLSKEDLLNLYREINIISKIKHPSFPNFIGFSPNNFKNKPKAVLIMDYPKNCGLDEHIDNLTNTQKSIIIYGIAAGMSFLHSNCIIHRNLNPFNIYIDDKYYPKIGGMGRSIQISKSDTFITELRLYEWTRYYAPEIFLNLEYSKSADVYSYGLTMYEIFSKKAPFEFKELNDFYEKVGENGFRPEMDESIPPCYRRLIEKCWSQDPKKRPSFDEVLSELQNNNEYVTCFEGDFDNEAFLEYKKYIDESPRKCETQDFKCDQVDELLKEKMHLFNKSEELNKRLKYSDSELYINFDDYEKSGGELVHKETGIKYSINRLSNLSNYLRNEIATIAHNANTISMLDHPSIIKLCGFSQVDFNNEPNPLYITNEHDYDIILLYSTPNILITLYGVAAGMAYLHSHDILHRDLKSGNIRINQNGVTAISGFNLSQEINDKQCQKIVGTPAYIAPEVYLHKQYCKASDVYQFALFVYEFLTHEKPYNQLTDPSSIRSKVAEENFRPEFNVIRPKIYRDLIERCWSPDPNDRPTFEEIANDLKTNHGYLTADIDKENFYEFVKYIDEYPAKFDPLKKVKFFDDILNSKLHTFLDIAPNFPLKNMYQTEVNDLSFNTKYLDLDNLEISTLIATGSFYKVKKAVDKKTNAVYASKKTVKAPYSTIFKQRFLRHDIINFSRELNILLQVNHPSILKFIGHCVLDRLAQAFHLIVTEFASNGSLADYFGIQNSQENDRKKQEEEEEENKSLSFTQKFIIIYGIASGMSYLHLNNILHRDLKPGNIYLDDSLHPKISGFNISKEMNVKKIKPNKSIKGTPIYIAPEIYLHKGYCKANDVYSFALIVYELLTGRKPFSTISNPKEILTEIVEQNNRPQFTSSAEIPEKYRDLIERCWSSDPSSRPTFDDIVNELKTNEEYMTTDIDKKEVQEYIDMIDKSEASFNTSNRINQLEEYVKFKISKFKRLGTKVNRQNVWETELNDISFNLDFINVRTLEKQKLIQKENNFKYHQVRDTKTNKIYISKQTDKKGDTVDQLFSEIEKISQINHPSILKFIGYSSEDFKNRQFPVMISENASNGTLDRIFKFENFHETDSIIDDTKKLIILYGIAAGMATLHSHGLAHGNLNPTNIFLDDFLFAKIAGFEKSKKKTLNSPFKKGLASSLAIALFFKLDDQKRYKSPEVLLTTKIHPVYDVYSYAMVAYKLITGETPYKNAFSSGKEAYNKIYVEGYRPEFPESIPDCYKKLIAKCWSKELNERPTFDEIVYHLRTNKEFITDKVNKEEFESYVQYIDKSQNQLNNEEVRIDDFIKTQNQLFRKVKIDFNKLRNWKKFHFAVDVGTLNIDDFEKKTKIGSGGFGSVYKCLEKKYDKIYAAKISIYEIDQCTEDIIVNLSREIDIISCLNHPSIFKYIGYSPNDFKNRPKPVIITEFAPNGSLDKIIEMERNGFGNPDWDDTKKLINIYGIASGMRYLHSLNILHRDLKPGNILLDEFLQPKIADFGLSKKLTDQIDKIQKNDVNVIPSGFKGTYAYCSPEILRDQSYTQKGDVYAFGMIVFEIMTNEIIFEGYNAFKLVLDVSSGVHPQSKFPIPYSYNCLIEKCWSYNPEQRPSFENIVELLETDIGFITKNVDKNDYLNYISYVKDVKSYDPRPQFIVSFDKKQENEEKDSIFIDLTNYKREATINKGNLFKIYQVKDIKTESLLTAQVSLMTIKKLSNKDKDDLAVEIDMLKEISHPSLLKFIGFSPTDFKDQQKPVILMESFANGTLEDILEIERNGQIISEWNDTKRLITIFGIASAMSYLHSKGIIHRCLNPANIYMNEVLFPKLGDFGLSTKFFNKDCMTHQSITGFKGTPIYSAPEIIKLNEYTQKGDVYAFAFVVYEMVLKKKPFDEISNMNDIYKEVVVNGKRPELENTKIPFCYRKLIENCWSQNQSERPTFDEIVNKLKYDSNFITETVNKDDYQQYIGFIDNYAGSQLKVQEQVHEKIIEDQILINQLLAIKYSQENDTENIIKYFNILIKNGRTQIPLQFAIRLYKSHNYKQALFYFEMLRRVNHPIASYFIGVMKFMGHGLEKNKKESYEILKHLSDNGIDKATEFIEDHFKKE